MISSFFLEALAVDVICRCCPHRLEGEKMDNDGLQGMHQRISQEATDKESFKMDVSQLRRVVELHIRQLSALVRAIDKHFTFGQLSTLNIQGLD